MMYGSWPAIDLHLAWHDRSDSESSSSASSSQTEEIPAAEEPASASEGTLGLSTAFRSSLTPRRASRVSASAMSGRHRYSAGHPRDDEDIGGLMQRMQSRYSLLPDERQFRQSASMFSP